MNKIISILILCGMPFFTRHKFEHMTLANDKNVDRKWSLNNNKVEFV